MDVKMQQLQLSDEQIHRLQRPLRLVYDDLGRSRFAYHDQDDDNSASLWEAPSIDDEEWCSKLLEKVKVLYLGHAETEDDQPFKAIMGAMKRHNPRYALQEFGGPPMFLESAASLRSLQSLTVLNAKFDKLLADRLLAALESDECNIWDVRIIDISSDSFSKRRDHVDELSWSYALEQMCIGGVLKSLRLNHLGLSDLVLEVAAEHRPLPCKLEHLRLTVVNIDQFNSLAEANWDTLTSLHIVTMNFSKHAFQCIARLRIQHFGIDVFSQSSSYSIPVHAEEFLQLLEGSRLRRLLIYDAARRLLLPDREDQVKFVDYLDKNINCPLEVVEDLQWVDESIKQNCLEILKRNKVYRQEGLLDEEQIPPTTAKLFICGDSGVGKSTLRKNLTRRVWIPRCFQFSRSTYGIRLETLRFGDRRLVICDLAGQPEFHTLHHYFMRGTDKDLFLIVCKAPGGSEDGYVSLENHLKYWLRFIVAHRSLSEQKPRVLILLNYFPNSERQDLSNDSNQRCQEVISEYQDHIDFGNPPQVFNLNLKSYYNVQRFNRNLETALGGLIEMQPRVPKLCEEIVQQMNSAPVRPKVVSITEFKSLYGMEQVHNERLIRVCIMYLHDTGEVLSLEDLEAESSRDSSEQFVIVDVQWFLQDLVGQFLPRLDRDRAGGSTSTSRIPSATRSLLSVKAKIGKFDACSQEQVNYLLSCFERLGVTMRRSDSSDIIILPLLQTLLQGWEHDPRTSYSYWGRRFDCKDSKQRLLPFGIFNMLQVRLADKFSRTNIGKGWLYLVENRVHVIVKIGGTRGEWFDKHWVDVLVCIPFDDDSDDYLLETGDKLFQEVRTCLFQLCGAASWGCPSLELVEEVIEPGSVESNPGAQFPNVDHLSRVMVKIKEQGMRYNYTWPVDHKTTPVFQLLFPSERDAYFNEKRSALAAIQLQVENCLKDAAGSQVPMVPGRRPDDSIELIMRQVKESESQIIAQVKTTELNIISEIQRLEVVVKKQLESILRRSNDIMSKLEFHLEFEAPKYPFMTDDSNFLEKISAATFGFKSRLHFLCEDTGGCHPVEGQRGILIKVAPEWFKQAAPVLIPTLRILFFALKMVAVVGLGVAVPTPDSAFPKGLREKTIDTVCEQVFQTADRRLQSMLPSTKDLEKFHSSLDEFLKGKDFTKELGLTRKLQNERSVWLCEKHSI